jgi:hypothetical protein
MAAKHKEGMKAELLAELSRVFEAEASVTHGRHEQNRLRSIAGQLYSKAQVQRKRDIVKLLMEGS